MADDIQYIEDGVLKSMNEEVAKLEALDPRPHTTHYQVDEKARRARAGMYRVVLRYGDKEFTELTFTQLSVMLANRRRQRGGRTRPSPTKD